MNFNFFEMFSQLVLALAVTLGLIFLCFKFMGSKLNEVNNNKYIKVIERVQVTKENTILLVKIGEKGFVMSSAAGHMEKLSELSEEELNIIEENKKKIASDMSERYNEIITKSTKSFSKIIKKIISKEEKHEK